MAYRRGRGTSATLYTLTQQPLTCNNNNYTIMPQQQQQPPCPTHTLITPPTYTYTHTHSSPHPPTQMQGTSSAGGRVAYVPQNPWCQNLTIKDSILFGKEEDASRYAAVLHACALELDLSILPLGDQSKVGGGLVGEVEVV